MIFFFNQIMKMIQMTPQMLQLLDFFQAIIIVEKEQTHHNYVRRITQNINYNLSKNEM